jgi:hypothetical protein
MGQAAVASAWVRWDGESGGDRPWSRELALHISGKARRIIEADASGAFVTPFSASVRSRSASCYLNLGSMTGADPDPRKARRDNEPILAGSRPPFGDRLSVGITLGLAS